MKQKRRKTVATVSMDKISELPEPIIHHILFFMPAKDAAQTSVLSKTWKSMWNSLPRYDFSFDEEDFGYRILFPKRKEGEEFTDYVDKSMMILHEQKVIIENFRLSVNLRDDNIVSRIDQWIELANKNHIKKIDLNFKVGNTFKYYTLSTFVANSLVSLSLMRCKFRRSLFCDNTKFCCLRELKLVQVSVDDGEIIQTLLSNFPLLETFFLENPLGVENLQIFNLPRLKEAEIYGVDKVEIEAPNLRILCYHSITFNLKVTPSNQLRNLTIHSLNCTQQSVSNLISMFPFLEFLELHTRLEGLKISSIRLQQLRLFSLDMLHMGEFEIDTPNLHSLYMNTCFVIPSVFTINASSLLHVVVVARCPTPEDGFFVLFDETPEDDFDNQMAQWSVRLRKHLTRFNKVDHLVLLISNLNAFAPVMKQLSDETIPPLVPNVKHLTLASIPSAPDYSAFIDGLLWTCRPDILYIHSYPQYPSDEFIKFLYNKLVDHEKNQDCCKDYNIKCWRHYLKGFEFWSFDGIKKQDDTSDRIIFKLKW